MRSSSQGGVRNIDTSGTALKSHDKAQSIKSEPALNRCEKQFPSPEPPSRQGAAASAPDCKPYPAFNCFDKHSRFLPLSGQQSLGCLACPCPSLSPSVVCTAPSLTLLCALPVPRGGALGRMRSPSCAQCPLPSGPLRIGAALSRVHSPLALLCALPSDPLQRASCRLSLSVKGRPATED